MNTYASVYLGSAILALLATPLVARWAKAKGFMDRPGTRKVHKTPVPRVGGIAIILATLLLVLPVLALDNKIGQAFRKVQGQVIVLLAAATLVFFVGLVDDIRSLSAKIKLICLTGAALAICATGARIDSIAAPPLFELDLAWLSWPLTVLWIVGVTVALNFMDGLDGLAAGISAIVCAVIAVMAFRGGQLVMGVLMLALLGSLTGFLCFNFNPAKIFMGDCGSMFLGFVIGAGSVVCAVKKSALLGIAVPALVLGVPILDAMFTMVRRKVLDRRSIFAAERGHIHHKLLDKGLQHRNVVLAIYGVTFLGAGISMCVMITGQVLSLAVLGSAVLFLLLLFHFLGVARLGETVKAIRRNAAIARAGRQDRSLFEDAQLQVREADSYETWWKAVTDLAEKMEFERLALSINDGNSWAHTSVWRRPGAPLSPQDVVRMTVPVGDGHGGPVSWLEVAVQRNGSLEAVGRRVMYFGRLMDECIALAACPLGNPKLRAAEPQAPQGEPPSRLRGLDDRGRTDPPWPAAKEEDQAGQEARDSGRDGQEREP